MAVRRVVLASCGAAASLGALAFTVPSGSPATPRAPALRASAAPTTAKAAESRTASSGSTAAAGFALAGVAACAAAAQRRRKTQRQAFCSGICSSGSGFYGEPTVSSFSPSTDEYSERQGAASMGMKNQVWWVTSNGFDWKGGGKIYDSRRRESRRRGEEMFRHDVDTYEMTLSNLISAPGAKKKKVRRGRGKYAHHGRTCGYGMAGAHKRGRRAINPGYEGASAPLHIKTPILTQEQRDTMRRDPFTPLHLAELNMCQDGEEVDFMDLFIRGLPVAPKSKAYPMIKVKGEDEDEFTVKNLTVYAHAFEPPAREKIEKLGGKCIRLHEWANTPIDMNINVELPELGAVPVAAKETVESAEE